ncbi:unnamed protein product, partial [Iphiclides podalirius]
MKLISNLYSHLFLHFRNLVYAPTYELGNTKSPWEAGAGDARERALVCVRGRVRVCVSVKVNRRRHFLVIACAASDARTRANPPIGILMDSTASHGRVRESLPNEHPELA